MIYFLDASALAKRYLVEVGTDRVRLLFRRNAEIVVSRISEVEVASALVRRMSAGDLDEHDAEMHLATLTQDMAAFAVVEIRKPVVASARELVREHGLRAYDAMQLAAALRAKGTAPITFLCADGELADAAVAERLRVERLG
ncbi:MAG: type II toxin-antitoxin system VapC family toxin [Deltaproteobacteria bacterium]|nr:type II toxin-antitoxin system VapC family toxin [Deltaproteobacteria bacterium]